MQELLRQFIIQSKMGLFRCRDLLELNTSVSITQQSDFLLFKATDSIIKIIELQMKPKGLTFRVNFGSPNLGRTKFRGDVIKY